MPLAFGPFLLDHARATLARGGSPVDVQPRVIAAIELFARSGGRILSREDLLDALWPDVVVSDDALHQLLRKVRRALDDDPAAPRYLQAVARRGWRFLAPVVDVGGAPGLIGRRAELGAVHAALAERRPVALHGPAGVGKSTIARAALPEATSVSLRDARSADDALDAVTAALHLPVGARPDPEAIGRVLLYRPDTALLLEDCEAVAHALPALLRAWDGARILLTSRVRVDGCLTVAVPELPEDDAIALFSRRYAETFPSAPLPPPAEVLALVRGLDALPLAIELAVARLRVLPLAELFARVTRSQRVLAGPDGGVRRSIQASLDLLSASDRRLLALLSVFPGTFSADHVEQLGVVPAAGVVDGVCRLVDASLVSGAPGTFRLLAAVREVAAEGRGADDLRAWARWTARSAAPELPGLWVWDVGSLVRLAARARDLATAVHVLGPGDSSHEEGDDDRSLHDALAVAMAGAVRYTGPWSAARQALEAVPQPSAAVRALLAEYRIRTGDVPGAMPLLDQLRGSTDPSSRTPRAFATFLSARLATAMGDAPRGRTLALEALSLSDANPALAALALEQAGLSALRAGDPSAARTHLAAAVARCAAPTLVLLHAVVTQNHAATLGVLGDHVAALAELRSAERALVALPFPHLLAAARSNLGEALANLQQTGEAVPLLLAAFDLGASVGDTTVERHTTALLGLCALAEGRPEEAERWLRRGVAIAGPFDAAAWRRLALFELDQGRDGVAAELLARAAEPAGPEGEAARTLLTWLAHEAPSPLPPLPGVGPLEHALAARLVSRRTDR